MKQKYDWTTLLILAIFGLHRFYVGRIGSGIAQWLTAFGFGVWWLIDILAITKGEFTDSEGNPIQKTQISFAGPAKTNSLNVADELKKFKELLDSGVINQEEFDKKKKELLQ
jgi:TM2 domain-containing membrane protein YozV